MCICRERFEMRNVWVLKSLELVARFRFGAQRAQQTEARGCLGSSGIDCKSCWISLHNLRHVAINHIGFFGKKAKPLLCPASPHTWILAGLLYRTLSYTAE